MKCYLSLYVIFVSFLLFICCSIEINETNAVQLLRIQKDGLYGFIDTLGVELIKPQYKYVGPFSKSGYALVISNVDFENDTLTIKYGYIDKKNNLIVDTINLLSANAKELEIFWNIYNAEEFASKFESKNLLFRDRYFEELGMPKECLYPFQDRITNKIGYKNLKGENIIPPRYKSVKRFCKNVAIVAEEPTYDYKVPISEGLNIFSLIDAEGNYIRERAWAFIQPFSETGLTWCAEFNIEEDDDGHITESLVWTQVDLAGKITIGPFDAPVGSMIFNGYPDNNDLYIYSFPVMFGKCVYSFLNKDGKFATDRNGDLAIEVWGENAEVFEDVTSFSEGLAGVKVYIDDKSYWTFMDPKFEIVTSELYDSIIPFNNGIAIVEQMNPMFKHFGNWGAIDKSFNVIIPFKYSELSQFHNGFAYAKISSRKYDRVGYINKRGEFIWETKHIH